jgi:hypothetical protein
MTKGTHPEGAHRVHRTIPVRYAERFRFCDGEVRKEQARHRERGH